ncbi:MAG: hypothetical protein AB2551_18930 [Candidatus Thiodiazotropha sp.]
MALQSAVQLKIIGKKSKILPDNSRKQHVVMQSNKRQSSGEPAEAEKKPFQTYCPPGFMLVFYIATIAFKGITTEPDSVHASNKPSE